MTRAKSRRPIIDPLLLILRSRRVMVAFCALLVSLLVLAVPELKAVQNELLALVVALALGLIGSYSVEEAVSASKSEARPLSDDALRDLVKRLLIELMDEVAEDVRKKG